MLNLQHSAPYSFAIPQRRYASYPEMSPFPQVNLQFFKQAFHQPLQYGLACYEHPSDESAGSIASTKRWPSDEQYASSSNSSSGTLPVQEKVAAVLPIRELQQLVELERTVSSMQQYECLLAHLQVLLIRHNGVLNEMFSNFIADSVLGRVGFASTKNGKFECTMRTDFKRIMKALKSAWFPNTDNEAFENLLAQMMKKAHSRCKGKEAINEHGQSSNSTTVEDKDINTKRCEAVVRNDVDHQQNATPKVQKDDPSNTRQLLDQWYKYAIYNRERYQMARDANQKMKAHFLDQDKVNKRSVSRCLRQIRSMQKYMGLLEQRLARLE